MNIYSKLKKKRFEENANKINTNQISNYFTEKNKNISQHIS